MELLLIADWVTVDVAQSIDFLGVTIYLAICMVVCTYSWGIYPSVNMGVWNDKKDKSFDFLKIFYHLDL